MRDKLLLVPILIITLALVTLYPWQSVQADTYVVTNTNDSGPGSLRQAISDANTHPGADVITFAAATDSSPITLTGTPNENANATGDLDILDGGDLIIQGNGSPNTIIDGGGVDRVFHICPVGGCTFTVTITGVIIQNGSVGGGGGGIRNEAGIAIIDESYIRNNSAINGGGISNFATLIIQNGSVIGGSGAGNHSVVGNGGGIYNYAGTLTINNSTVWVNSADNNGGGIWNQSTLNIQNGSTIGGFGVGNTAGNDGGGIHNYAGTTTIDGGTISKNSAINNGGGIWNQATLNIQNGSTIGWAGVGNTAGNDGGGIYNFNGTSTVDGSNIQANSAINNGGGIWSQATLNILNGSTIGGFGVGNTAGNDGGGIHNYAGTTTIDSSNVQANSAINNGGGIWSQATLNIQNGSTISSNSADYNGGGIWSHGTLNVLNGSTIGGFGVGNTAGNSGGGIYNWYLTTTIDNSKIQANLATGFGGGIATFHTLIIQNGSTIGGVGAGNSADFGGGITNFLGGTMTVNNSTISANVATTAGGGIVNSGTLLIQNGSIIGGIDVGNTADNGGGIFTDNLTTIDGSSVSANSATRGGGIYNNAELNVQNDSTIGGIDAGNSADSYGGGICNASGTTTINSSTVSANSATRGAGIYNIAVLNVQNGSTIGGVGAGNTASNSGGGIFNSGGTATVDGCRILNNTATSNGGGVFTTGPLVATSVTNSCIVGNSVMSFYNDATTQQIATGNWWGAPTGPNTPGADTVLGNVDVSGYLTSPILDCAPELEVSKSNDTGGVGSVDTPFKWSLSIANIGFIDADFGVGQKILEDDLPLGPIYGTPVAGNFVDITNSSNIDCYLVGNKLTCEATGDTVTLGAVTGSFEVTFSVTPSTPGSLVNPAGICQVDPDGNVTEGDESNNNCPLNVVTISTPTTNLYLPVAIR